MITVFERIPDVFVEVYDAALRRWGREFRTMGPRVTIRLRTPLEPSALAADPRRTVGVVLVAMLDGDRMVVRPANEANEEAIRRHAAELRRAVLA